MNTQTRQLCDAIERCLANVEIQLADAGKYVAQNVNVESSSWFHFGDWSGKSGHPLWMKNHMIPSIKKVRAKWEKALERVRREAKDKRLTLRKRQHDDHWGK